MLSAPPSAAFSGPLLSFPFACEEATLPRPGWRRALGLGQDSFLCVCQCSINYAVGRFGPSGLSLDSLECEPDLTEIDHSGRGSGVLPNADSELAGSGMAWVWASLYFCLSLRGPQ